jgi:hypothetical protein
VWLASAGYAGPRSPWIRRHRPIVRVMRRRFLCSPTFRYPHVIVAQLGPAALLARPGSTPGILHPSQRWPCQRVSGCYHPSSPHAVCAPATSRILIRGVGRLVPLSPTAGEPDLRDDVSISRNETRRSTAESIAAASGFRTRRQFVPTSQPADAALGFGSRFRSSDADMTCLHEPFGGGAAVSLRYRSRRVRAGRIRSAHGLWAKTTIRRRCEMPTTSLPRPALQRV